LSQQAAVQPVSRRAVIASLVGTSIEWYDYFLYGTAASLVFNKIFFPTVDPIVGLLLAYATFALSFIIRPLGGILFSHIGDKIGRKRTLVLTLMLMGIATVLIGLLPGYHTIGNWAPILLIFLRLIQGLGIGGEWGGAVLLAVEYAPKEKRGLFGSVPQMGVPIGLVLGTFAMSLIASISGDAFYSWGWRIPFILSFVLVLVGLWIRGGIDETPAFKKAKESGEIAKVPLLDTFKYQWKTVLLAVGTKVVETAPFYILSTFVISYATGLGFEESSVLNAVAIAALVTTILIPFMGALSDRWGRKPLYIAGTVGMILFSFPYFMLLSTGSNLWLTVACVLGLGVIWAPITAVLGTLMSEVFRTNVRYTGVTLGYQLGAALAGGTAPFIATALLARFNNAWEPVALYMILTSVISLVAILALRETKEAELDDPAKD
jgi:metabolite-proton symporter